MTTTFFFCNTTTKALCRSPVAYSRSTPFCCFVSLLVLDFLWITSLNFVTSLTPESTFTHHHHRIKTSRHYVCRRVKILFFRSQQQRGFWRFWRRVFSQVRGLECVTSSSHFSPKCFLCEMFPAFDDANRLPSLCLSPRAIIIGGSSALRSIPARRRACGVVTVKAAKPPQVNRTTGFIESDNTVRPKCGIN